MKYFTMGGRIKTEPVNGKYDIRVQATGGLTMDNYCFGDNHNPAKTFFQLQQLWYEQSEGGAQGDGLFLQRQIFVVKVFVYKWRCLKNKSADSPSSHRPQRQNVFLYVQINTALQSHFNLKKKANGLETQSHSKCLFSKPN